MKKLKRALRTNIDFSQRNLRLLNPRKILTLKPSVDHISKDLKDPATASKQSCVEATRVSSLKSIKLQRSASEWWNNVHQVKRQQRTLTLTSEEMIRITETRDTRVVQPSICKPRPPTNSSRLGSSISKYSFARSFGKTANPYGLLHTEASCENLGLHEMSVNSIHRGMEASTSRSGSRSHNKLVPRVTKKSREEPTFFDRQVSLTELARFASQSNRTLSVSKQGSDSQILITSLGGPETDRSSYTKIAQFSKDDSNSIRFITVPGRKPT
jgi:hypothetical protein